MGENISDKIKNDMENFADISENYKAGYDFYILLNKNEKMYPDNSLVFVREISEEQRKNKL